MDGVAKEKRQVAKAACDFCKRRKIKCEPAPTGSSQCDNCFTTKLECTYDIKPVQKRKKRVAVKTTLTRLEHRLLELEHLLAEQTNKEVSPAGESTSSPSSTTSTSPTDVNRRQKVDIGLPLPGAHNIDSFTEPDTTDLLQRLANSNISDPFSGTSFFSKESQDWIFARTGNRIKVREDQDPNVTCPFMAECLSLPLLPLPDKTMLNEAVKRFRYAMVNEEAYPVLDDQTVEAFAKIPDFNESVGARALAYMIIAWGFSLPNEWKLENHHARPTIDMEALASEMQVPLSTRLKPDYCIRAFYQLLPQIQFNSDVMGIQATLLLIILTSGTANPRGLFMLMGIAARMLIMHGAHIETADPQLRRLFWVCYILDKDMVVRTGQSPAFNDNEVDLTLPLLTSTEGRRDVNLFVPSIKLSILKSNIYTQLYSRKSERLPSGVRLKSVRELDEAISFWKDSLPSIMRFEQMMEPGRVSDVHNTDFNEIRWLLLQFEFFHCIASIHGAAASTVCQQSARAPDAYLFTKSSAAICVETARHTLYILDKGTSILTESELFWVTVWYSTSAVVGLFCNILQNPLDPDSESDLARIEALIRRFGAIEQQPLVGKTGHLDEVTDFLKQLAKLSRDAMTRAVMNDTEFAPQPEMDGASIEEMNYFMLNSADQIQADGAAAMWRAPMTFEWDFTQMSNFGF